jgi:hypothetical protein
MDGQLGHWAHVILTRVVVTDNAGLVHGEFGNGKFDFFARGR